MKGTWCLPSAPLRIHYLASALPQWWLMPVSSQGSCVSFLDTCLKHRYILFTLPSEHLFKSSRLMLPIPELWYWCWIHLISTLKCLYQEIPSLDCWNASARSAWKSSLSLWHCLVTTHSVKHALNRRCQKDKCVLSLLLPPDCFLDLAPYAKKFSCQYGTVGDKS